MKDILIGIGAILPRCVSNNMAMALCFVMALVNIWIFFFLGGIE